MPMPIRFAADTERQRYRLERRLAVASGLGHWPPHTAGEWETVFERAGFTEERFRRFFDEELPAAETSTGPGTDSSADYAPLFSAALLAGLEERAPRRGRGGVALSGVAVA